MKRLLCTILLLLVLCPVCSAWAASSPMLAPTPAGRLRMDQVTEQIWQRINQARSNPMAELHRLGLNEAEVRARLGADAWILDRGLPPLAVSDTLAAAAAGHSREMFELVYYSSISAAGLDPAARFATAGYQQALYAEEALAAMVMERPVEQSIAIEALVDSLLRDELCGALGTVRNIFADTASELGLSLRAGNIALLPGRPYVYLLVVDFARPVTDRAFIIGQVDPDTVILARDRRSGQWQEVPLYGNRSFQIEHSGPGADLYFWNRQQADYVATFSTAGIETTGNHPLDLRGRLAQ